MLDWLKFNCSFLIVGSNKYATQKGMSIGGKRFGADFAFGAGCLASQKYVPLQSGNYMHYENIQYL